MIRVLIDLEGIDGCGKSTQCKLLKEKLERIGKNQSVEGFGSLFKSN